MEWKGWKLHKFSQCESSLSLNADDGEHFEKMHFDRPSQLVTEGYIM